MTPEAADLLTKARVDLDDARKILAISLATVAARGAYYAAFHAAEAFIAEQTGKVAKTHSGVRSEFARLIKKVHHENKDALAFLAQAYKYKEISDYGSTMLAGVAQSEAEHAIEKADAFLKFVTELLERI